MPITTAIFHQVCTLAANEGLPKGLKKLKGLGIFSMTVLGL
jgi:hypothetical protein